MQELSSCVGDFGAPRPRRHRLLLSLLLLTCITLAARVACATDFYVDPTGDDGDPGSQALPWRTLQKACDTATPGSTVHVATAVYAERIRMNVSGSDAAGPVTFQSAGPGRAVIDGAAISALAGDSALVTIDGESHIRFRRFEIRNYGTSDRWDLVMGMYVTGASHHIEILDNVIHHIANTATVNVDLLGRDAHALAVYGASGAQAVHDITIDGNEIADCTLGSSEALVLNGNVESFRVTNNHVHDNDNIGIDLIGWEGTAPANDQARNGLVTDNHVHHNSSIGNPAYTDAAAGGIYVDGGRDIVIERNTAHHNDLGVEVGCENAGRTTTNITVRNNVIYENVYTGIAFGGYDGSAGLVQNSAFLNNTLFHNDTSHSWTGEIVIQKAAYNIVKNNILSCHSQNVVFTSPFPAASSHDNTLDYNLFHGPAGAAGCEWEWRGNSYEGFAAYKAASGQDANSLFANPDFASPAAYDLHIPSDSPARNAADPAFTPAAGELDIDRQPRVQGPRVDIGADEFHPASRKGDFDNDSDVDASDFATFTATYGLAEPAPDWLPNGPIADFDDNGTVAFPDFMGFVDAYGT